MNQPLATPAVVTILTACLVWQSIKDKPLTHVQTHRLNVQQTPEVPGLTR